MGYKSLFKTYWEFNPLKQPTKKPVNPLDSSPLAKIDTQQPYVQATNQPVIPTTPVKKPSVITPPSVGSERKPPVLASQYQPVEQPKLGGDDFQSYYEKLTGVDKLKEAEAAKIASRETAEKAYQESQAAKGTLIQQSQDMFDKFFNAPEIIASKEDRAKAFANLQRIDAEEAQTLEKFRADSQIKGTPSWAYSRQQTIISGGYNAQRAGFAVDYAIANDKLTEAKDYATQAYNHGLTVLQAKMGLVEDALKHATDLSDQDKADYQSILDRAKTVYETKKKDQETAIATYISLASKGITGLNPSMSVEEMTKVAGPELVKQAQAENIAKKQKEGLEAQKTQAEIAKLKSETAETIAKTTGTGKTSELMGNVQLANDVLKNASKLSGFFQTGGIPFGIGGLSTPGTAGAEAKNKYNELIGLLKLENRQKLKGQGQISDFEGRILADASTALGRNLSEESFKDELIKVKGVFSTAAGLKVPVMITNPQTGEFTVMDADRAGIDAAVADGMDVKYK